VARDLLLALVAVAPNNIETPHMTSCHSMKAMHDSNASCLQIDVVSI